MALEFRLNPLAPASADTDCVVVGIFGDGSLSPSAQAIDQASGGRLAALVERGDVSGKTCVLVDDIVDTAGTLSAAAAALKAQGAQRVNAYCTHPVLSGPAIDNVNKSQLDELVVTDTIPLSDAARACSRIRQLSVAELLAETIRRVAFGESVSSLYVD